MKHELIRMISQIENTYIYIFNYFDLCTNYKLIINQLYIACTCTPNCYQIIALVNFILSQ